MLSKGGAKSTDRNVGAFFWFHFTNISFANLGINRLAVRKFILSYCLWLLSILFTKNSVTVSTSSPKISNRFFQI